MTITPPVPVLPPPLAASAPSAQMQFQRDLAEQVQMQRLRQAQQHIQLQMPARIAPIGTGAIARRATAATGATTAAGCGGAPRLGGR